MKRTDVVEHRWVQKVEPLTAHFLFILAFRIPMPAFGSRQRNPFHGG
jgi:hypothetical protein